MGLHYSSQGGGGQTLSLLAAFLIHSGRHTQQEAERRHPVWAQKKEGAFLTVRTAQRW